MLFSLIFGIFCAVAGLALRYWINRRKFYRRSMAGSEGFSSYEKSVIITIIERFGKWVAYALIILGILSILVYYHEKNEKEKMKKVNTVNKYSKE